jgi:hypothetical protein
MSYIGRGLQSGAFRQLDDISSGFDGSDTTHTMQVNSTNVTVGDVNQILLSLGGVIQKPGTDFTVSSSVLTFTTAPAANTSFFAILLGSDNGGTVTPTDGSVTTAKIVDANVTKAKLADSIDVFAGTSLSAADLGSGIHIKTADSGASVSSDADELILENSRAGMSFLSATDNYGIINFGDSGDNNIGQILYYHGDNSLSFVNNAQTGITLNTDGEVTKPLQPCFRIGSGTQANIAVSTNVTAIFDSEVFDIGSNFASNTFTAPVTGKYYLGLLMRLNAVDSAASYIQIVIVGSNRNTTVFTFHNATELSADADNVTVSGSTVLDMDANDTAYVRIRIQSGTAQTDVDSDGSYFTGYLIG